MEEREKEERRHACESFHGELRTEALLCLQPQGADKTPGRGRKKGTTGGKKKVRACARLKTVFPSVGALMRDK